MGGVFGSIYSSLTFVPVVHVYSGITKTSVETVPTNSTRLSYVICGGGGIGHDASPVLGGTGGGGAGSGIGDVPVDSSDWGNTLSFYVANFGENSSILGTLNFVTVSVLASAGGKFQLGGFCTGATFPYKGSDGSIGENITDGGQGGIGGDPSVSVSPIDPAVITFPGQGGQGGPAPSGTGSTGQPGYVIFSWK